jgi:hypothetical protein
LATFRRLFHAIAARLVAATHLSIGLKSDNETWALAQSGGSCLLEPAVRCGRDDVFSCLSSASCNSDLQRASDRGAASVIAHGGRSDSRGIPLRLMRHFSLASASCAEANLPAQIVPMGLGHAPHRPRARQRRRARFNRTMVGPDGARSLAGIAGFMLIQHLTERHRLDALLAACERVDPEAVRRLLWFIGGQESTAQIIFDRVWVTEAAAPDWPPCRRVFGRASALARR